VEGLTPEQASSALGARRAALERELAGLATRREGLAREHGAELGRARAAVGDRLLGMSARRLSAETAHSFVLEGWVPESERPRLDEHLRRRVPDPVVVEEVDREEWAGDPAPVVLRNPRLFRPFESLTAMMPLPAYGSIDATPFVAVFFPMFFGLVLGDIGYGLLLAAIALVLRALSKPGTPLRSVGEVAGACAAFSVAFGLAFGELFGDLGRRWFGLHPLLFDREEELMSFLGLVLAIGIVHIVLGLVLGAANALRGHHRRHAIGSGVSAMMVVLLLVVLLAAFKVLPEAFFTPAVVILLAVFPVLVVAEGLIAPLEFLSTLSNILSYARIMALGTASVMMAVVANQLVGTFGSALVGVLFAVLFHLVNFAIGVFAPTIHGLRLHYVEFFGKFYSPGGVPYRPFGHWRPPRPQSA
jgi:V/A-type H+-transporting ATPase subunit I